MNPTLSIIVPVLNEARNLPHVFAALPEDAEVIVVDAGSVDDTVEVARRLRPSAIVVEQTRRGKGNALACGFALARGDVIVMLDADGSTDPAEIPRFVQALIDGADFAKGSRFCPGGDSEDITGLRRLGNWGLNTLVNLLLGTRFTDLCYGYNAFRREVLADLDLPPIDLPAPRGGQGKLWGDGFEIETLINMRVAQAGYRIVEVPSVEAPRRYGESNLNAVRDGLRVLRTILHEYVTGRRRRKARRGRTPEPVLRPDSALTSAGEASAQAGEAIGAVVS